jgi:hypothetical protein
MVDPMQMNATLRNGLWDIQEEEAVPYQEGQFGPGQAKVEGRKIMGMRGSGLKEVHGRSYTMTCPN